MEEAKSILVVDDDRSILRILKNMLESEGYDVDTAETGQEAIEKSQLRFYNLALLDIKLPDMEGTELLEKMHENLPKMMKIMVTGYPDLENAVQSLNMGADAYLVKPVNPETMLNVVKEKLSEQEETEIVSQEKVKKWIETRVRRLRQYE